MNKIEEFDDFLISLWETFDEVVQNSGYQIMINNDSQMGRGTLAFKKDKFAPIIELCVYNQEKYAPGCSSLNLIVYDRLGNNIIVGNIVEVNNVKCGLDSDKEDVENRFKFMLEEVLEKYFEYDNQNRLDYEGETISLSY